MTTLNRVLLTACVLGLMLPTTAEAKDRDKDKKKAKTTQEPARLGGGPAPGSCEPGVAESSLDANRVTARLFNNGSLFYGNSVNNQYVVEGTPSIFASGIWIGGQVNGDIVTAGSRYEDFEFWPGPLGDDGRPVNPSDCSAFDRMWKVSIGDIERYEALGTIARDLGEWPVELGAPVIAAPDNGIDDDGDGLVDEGTNELDDDGDGIVDEPGERERVDLDARAMAGMSPYDLAAGDRPDIILDQSIWWIMNDVGNAHAETNSNPIGVEVRGQAFAIGESGPLGNTTFYKYTIVNKSGLTVEDTYLSVFSDPDLGAEFGDDYVGSSISQSVGYVYNADDLDVGGYGRAVPAVGYDFFQGPIVDGDTLGLSSFNYFINGGPATLEDPSDRVAYYNVMQGLTPTGEPLTVGGLGVSGTGEETKFAFSGDPLISGEEGGWNEVGEENNPGDRRFVVSTGPFPLLPGDEQEIVFGIVWARAESRTADSPNLASLATLLVDDISAQEAYDNEFQIRRAPPAPPTSAPVGSAGNGTTFLSAAEEDGQVVLTWGYPESSSNFNGSFDQQGVAFEGFNVYQYTNSSFANPQLIATYDKVSDPALLANIVLDPTLIGSGANPRVPELAAFGTNSGLQYFHVINTNLINNRDYYFGVTAYGVDPEAELRRVFESLPALITVRPTLQTGISQGGSQAQTQVSAVTDFIRSGDSFRTLSAQVVNPQQILDATYRVDIVSLGDSLDTPTYTITRKLASGDSTVLYDGRQVFENTGRAPLFDERQVFDGLAFFEVGSELSPLDFQNLNIITPSDDSPDFVDNDSLDIAGSGFIDEVARFGLGIVEIESGLGDPCSVIDYGCQFYNGNTVFNDENAFRTYFFGGVSRDSFIPPATRIIEDVAINQAEDIDIRFTEACANDATPCYGLYYSGLIGGLDESIVTRVPFEAYSVGLTENDNRVDEEGDDVRLIPILRPRTEDADGEDVFYADWSDSFTREMIAPDGVEVNGVTPDTLRVNTSEETYLFYPTQRDGYSQFAAAAASSGGGGAIYMDTFSGDPECSTSAAYADFCYRSEIVGGSRNFLIGRGVFADLDGDGRPPVPGTTVRFNFVAQRSEYAIGDSFTLDAQPLAFVTGQRDIAGNALDRIGVTPNPYRGRSSYERASNDRRVRFVGLPEQARIRIYTVAGSLIRTIDKTGPGTTIDWNLETQNNLPVASGMYLVHVEARDGEGNQIGERVLKLGVIQRQTRVNIF